MGGQFKKGEKKLNQGKRGPAKTTLAAKEAIALAADKLGGADRLYNWAQEDPANERVFWGTIYPKLLPLQVTGDKDNPLQVVQRVELIALGDDNSPD
ncbi:hypothetical protein PIN31009_01889 [Pandoraea iniqua]|uniref:hypothetical protein n=1 Tax=Pandoraea iniqua TaxID=2508288 RepID=UPI00124179B7|nr:hypothetical protein [Pandoraea iniqua]VVD96239.1 hypothetical protein PIN31009_01889 [Pandoraea iniqua]